MLINWEPNLLHRVKTQATTTPSSSIVVSTLIIIDPSFPQSCTFFIQMINKQWDKNRCSNVYLLSLMKLSHFFSFTWMTSSITSFVHLPLAYSKYIKKKQKLPVLNIQITLTITYKVQDFEFFFVQQLIFLNIIPNFLLIDIIHNHSLSKVRYNLQSIRIF